MSSQREQSGGYYSIPQGKISGAGVLLVSYFDGKIPSVVLIYSKNKQAFEEPGGGSHGRTLAEDYGKICDTARRELLEETANLIHVRDKKMYNHFIDIRIKRSHSSLWFYRTYVMHIAGISRQDFLKNLELIEDHQNTPRHFLEADDLVIAPLHLFRKIYKIGNENAIKVGKKFVLISKRLKHIMNSGGLDLTAKVLLTTRPVFIEEAEQKLHKKGWKKGTVTYII